MKSQEKIYLGNLKTSTTFGEEILEGYLNISDLKKQLENWVCRNQSGDELLNIKIMKRKATDKFNQSHYIVIDQFKFELSKITASDLAKAS